MHVCIYACICPVSLRLDMSLCASPAVLPAHIAVKGKDQNFAPQRSVICYILLCKSTKPYNNLLQIAGINAEETYMIIATHKSEIRKCLTLKLQHTAVHSV